MHGISVIIITYNEEENIRPCLESVKWADEIIVVDSNSRDNTVKIAQEYTDKIYEISEKGFAFKRNYAIDKAGEEWILWIDADERISENLRNEILTAVKDEQDISAFRINRRSFFINKFIKHCGWYPDYSIRLFKKSTGIKFSNARVHEELTYSGKTAKLSSELIHYTDLTFEHYVKKMNLYTSNSALDHFDNGKSAGLSDIIFRPAFAFFRMYFLKLGFLDGFTGLVLCTLSSIHVFIKYSKLYFLTEK